MAHRHLLRTFALTVFAFLTGVGAATAQNIRTTEVILAFSIHGITVDMSLAEAEGVARAAGFEEMDRIGESPSDPISVSFSKGNVWLDLNITSGVLTGVSETRDRTSGVLDYSEDLARVKAHFSVPSGDTDQCPENARGAVCSFEDEEHVAVMLARMTPIQVVISVLRQGTD